MSILALLQSPQVDVLGITVVTGNAWRDDEARHALRMLELIGRSDVPVALGAVFPLLRTQQETRLMTPLVGNVAWLGAYGQRLTTLTPAPAGLIEPPAPAVPLGPWDTPPLLEGEPHTKPIAEDAPHFLIRQVHAHPHQVTIYAAGPLTDIALATALDPHFAELSAGLVVMGGSLNPHTDDPEFSSSPRHEFNFWFDPEAAHMTLRAHWPRIDDTTVDVSIKTMFTRGDAGRDLEVPQSGGAIHREVFAGAVLLMGRARGLRLARPQPHHAATAIYTWMSMSIMGPPTAKH